MKRFHHTLTSLSTAFLVMFIGFATPAQAVAPAGTSLSITVTVSHDQDDGKPEETESMGVTVGLSLAAPTLSAPADQTVLPEESINYSYTITTNANGSETYNLNASVTTVDNLDGSPAVFFEQDGGLITSVILGATAASTTQTTGSDFVLVPHDGGADLASVNGIQRNDTVVIGGAEYEVSGVGYDANFDSMVIGLRTPLVSSVQVGDLIAERQGFEMIISGVGVADPDSMPGTVMVTVTAASASDETLSTPDESITSVLIPIGPSLETYVRNDTDPTTGSDPSYVDSLGQKFFDLSVVAAKAGDTLEYVIIQKAGNTQSLTGVKIQVAMPLFTGYVAGSTRMDGVLQDDVGDPSQSPLIDGMEVYSTAVTPVVEAGTISVNSLVAVTFKVKMDEATTEETKEGDGELSNAKIQWDTGPDRVTFTWSVTGLSSEYESWVYPHVGFTENGGPFGSTPEDEANRLKNMYTMTASRYRSAGDGTGSWNWYGGKPTNPSGQLVLLAYDPSSGNAWVVDISEEINIDAW